MTKDSGFIEMAYSSIPVFADDGTLDLEELNFLMGMALRDGEVDEDEKRVLRNIFAQVKEHEVAPKVWTRITEIKKKHQL